MKEHYHLIDPPGDFGAGSLEEWENFLIEMQTLPDDEASKEEGSPWP